ncbi:exopolyphosphatase [Methylomonas sp. LWB]|uniref:exopolyphosphatase n=1 Tax=unclassified Methylomonas TaxID=2608980 RepID=UPI0008D9FC79|nr:exopolyphosphatase [Methylomonas sp. LWB]NJA05462.1 exopolyphosphatase [Methylococcaceae bacterium WWC4]OHX36385.1 exopolyphosphatase [Methylomonas sp. LWB]
MPFPIPTSVAAVDLGSNSFHMIICSLMNGKLQTVDRLKEMVRLAAGLDQNRNLEPATQERALACLERFGQRIRNFPPHSVAIVGTNTLRIARNSQQFINKAEKALGHPIHIISGIEEARLIYQGVAHSLGSDANNRFVMDIGGSSTEYIIGREDVAHIKESLNMGCVTVSQAFFKSGKINKKAFRNAMLFAEHHLEPFQDTFNRKQWDEAIGASGSLKAVSNVLQTSGWSNNGITMAGLDALVEHLLKLNDIAEIDFPALSIERRPVFIGAVAIVYATFKTLNIEQMTVADGALREGLVYDLLGRIYNHDIRGQTCELITARYHTDRRHSEQLKATLRYMAEQLNDHPSFADNPATLQFLEWAADLHEIGFEIAHSQYHKHSAYIIENGDLAGFSKQDQLLLASLVRSHRKKFKACRFEDLPMPWRQHAPIMAILFRLAALLHRNRHSPRPDFKLNVEDRDIRIDFPQGWLEQAPLTDADLRKEMLYLKESRFNLIFDQC